MFSFKENQQKSHCASALSSLDLLFLFGLVFAFTLLLTIHCEDSASSLAKKSRVGVLRDKRGLFSYWSKLYPSFAHHFPAVVVLFFFLAQIIFCPAAHALNLGNQRSSMVCKAGRIFVVLPPFQNLMWKGI